MRDDADSLKRHGVDPKAYPEWRFVPRKVRGRMTDQWFAIFDIEHAHKLVFLVRKHQDGATLRMVGPDHDPRRKPRRHIRFSLSYQSVSIALSSLPNTDARWQLFCAILDRLEEPGKFTQEFPHGIGHA